eukprot:3154888-Amphidinium_carterae.2
MAGMEDGSGGFVRAASFLDDVTADVWHKCGTEESHTNEMLAKGHRDFMTRMQEFARGSHHLWLTCS